MSIVSLYIYLKRLAMCSEKFPRFSKQFQSSNRLHMDSRSLPRGEKRRGACLGTFELQSTRSQRILLKQSDSDLATMQMCLVSAASTKGASPEQPTTSVSTRAHSAGTQAGYAVLPEIQP